MAKRRGTSRKLDGWYKVNGRQLENELLRLLLWADMEARLQGKRLNVDNIGGAMMHIRGRSHGIKRG